jgi:hypothetical protein
VLLYSSSVLQSAPPEIGTSFWLADADADADADANADADGRRQSPTVTDGRRRRRRRRRRQSPTIADDRRRSPTIADERRRASPTKTVAESAMNRSYGPSNSRLQQKSAARTS